MPDHASVEATHASGLPHAKRREIVVEHEGFLLVLEFDGVDELRIAGAAQGERGQNVCLSAVEEACAVNDGRDAASLREERSYLIERATVDAFPLFNREVVHVSVDAFLEVHIEYLRFRFRHFFKRVFHPVRFELVDVFFCEFAGKCLDLWGDDLPIRTDDIRSHVWIAKRDLLAAMFFEDTFLPRLDFLYLL